jgi:chromosome segregation ATPase
LDLFAIAVDAVSLLFLIFITIVGTRAIHAFRQSKQAVTESASLISVIVDALSSRIEQSESAINELRSDMGSVKQHSAGLEDEQASIRSSHLHLLRHLQEVLANDKRLIVEFEQLKEKFSSFQQKAPAATSLPKREGLGGVMTSGDILGSLTPTERQTLEILRREGPKAAPELGKRLKKSREHTSRLMKKLYLEGFVDRESNRAPFRYKLNEAVVSALESRGGAVTAKASEMA